MGVQTLGMARSLATIGLGAAMPNATALVADYTPRYRRNLAVGIAMAAVPIGGFLGGIAVEGRVRPRSDSISDGTQILTRANHE